MEPMKFDTFAIMLIFFFFFFFFFLRVDVVSKSSRFDTMVCIILFQVFTNFCVPEKLKASCIDNGLTSTYRRPQQTQMASTFYDGYLGPDINPVEHL